MLLCTSKKHQCRYEFFWIHFFLLDRHMLCVTIWWLLIYWYGENVLPTEQKGMARWAKYRIEHRKIQAGENLWLRQFVCSDNLSESTLGRALYNLTKDHIGICWGLTELQVYIFAYAKNIACMKKTKTKPKKHRLFFIQINWMATYIIVH